MPIFLDATPTAAVLVILLIVETFITFIDPQYGQVMIGWLLVVIEDSCLRDDTIGFTLFSQSIICVYTPKLFNSSCMIFASSSDVESLSTNGASEKFVLKGKSYSLPSITNIK